MSQILTGPLNKFNEDDCPFEETEEELEVLKLTLTSKERKTDLKNERCKL